MNKLAILFLKDGIRRLSTEIEAGESYIKWLEEDWGGTRGVKERETLAFRIEQRDALEDAIETLENQE
jgi:hypothetical protein